MYSLSVRLWRVLIALGLVTTGLILSLDAGARLSPASAATCRTAQTPSPGPSELIGVSVTSSRNAWAVGFYVDRGGAERTLIEHWNGKAWKVQTGPNPTPHARGYISNRLSGVAATSSTNAWAVGSYRTRTTLNRPLIEHWNGKAWTVQASPKLRGQGQLSGVAATSARNAWAVGYYYPTGTAGIRALIEHWNGKAWRIQASPNVDELRGVDATSATNAWAVGYYSGGARTGPLIEHWNGKAWKVQTSPPSPNLDLNAVAATSSTNAWAVGGFPSMIAHWNGKAWTVQASPRPRGFKYSGLSGVAASSSTNVWVVGFYYPPGPAGLRARIEHWNGKAWTVQASHPRGFKYSWLSGVAASSSTNVWAVGSSSRFEDRSGPVPDRTLALHCG